MKQSCPCSKSLVHNSFKESLYPLQNPLRTCEGFKLSVILTSRFYRNSYHVHNTNLGFSSRSEPHNVPWRRANMSPPPVTALNNCEMHHKTAELIQSDPPCARKAKPSGEGKREWKDAILSLRVPIMGTGWCELLVGWQRPSQLLRQSNTGSGSASRDSPTHSQRRGRVC